MSPNIDPLPVTTMPVEPTPTKAGLGGLPKWALPAGIAVVAIALFLRKSLHNYMAYRIKQYTKDQAKSTGYQSGHPRSKAKRLTFKDGKKVASVGALGYNDYPTFMELERKGKVEKGTANRRRKAYKTRHAKDRKVRGSNGWYADKLLW